ncbi:hypothetical protein D3C87_1249730 [compost metagenome]
MSDEDRNVTVTFELSRTEAWALAQFCKRTTHQDCLDHSMAEDEAYEMMRGVGAVMRGLAEEGIAPR